MTLPTQLRAIADRLEAATLERNAALNEVARVGYYVVTVLGADPDAMRDGSSIEPDSAAVPAAPTDAGVVQVATTPARHAGDAGSTPATRSNDRESWRMGFPPDELRCPECGNASGSRQQLAQHRRRHKGKSIAPHDDPSEPDAHLFAADAARKAHPHAPRPGDGRLIDEDCPNCGQHFTWKPALGNHLKQHAGDTNGAPAVVAIPVIRKGRETFLCNRCSEPFGSREKLDDHLLLKHPDNEPRRMPVGSRSGALHGEVERVLHPGVRT